MPLFIYEDRMQIFICLLVIFLYESIILSLVGGLIGLIMVLAGTILINSLWDMNMYLTIGNVFLALFISGSIGVISGYAPAQSASRLDPVEAIGTTF